MIHHEKSEFWRREFLIIQETINSELRNSADKRDLISTPSMQKMKTI